jgi:hypothetical protein
MRASITLTEARALNARVLDPWVKDMKYEINKKTFIYYSLNPPDIACIKHSCKVSISTTG